MRCTIRLVFSLLTEGKVCAVGKKSTYDQSSMKARLILPMTRRGGFGTETVSTQMRDTQWMIRSYKI